MHNAGIDIFETVAKVKILAEKVQTLGKKRSKTVAFENVAPPAQAFLAALLARTAAESIRHLWFICETPRSQERFYSELSDWFPLAILLPDVEVAAVEGAVPDPEVSAERLAALQKIGEAKDRQVVVINQQTLDALVPALRTLHDLELALKRGARVDRDEVVRRLVEAGYETASQVAERGQFSVRGGILDAYSWQHALPVRLEWFDEEIESIREFDLDQQVSIRTLEHCTLLLGEPEGNFGPLREYLGKNDLTVAVGAEFEEARSLITAGVSGQGEDAGAEEDYGAAFYESPLIVARQSMSAPGQREMADRQIKAQFQAWQKEKYTVYVLYRKEAELSSLRKTAHDWSLDEKHLRYLPAATAAGFVLPAARLAVITAGEMLGYQQQASSRFSSGARGRGILAKQRTQIDFAELSRNDLVVHLEHGLAKFLGLQSGGGRNADFPDGEEEPVEEFMMLEFAEGAKLYVPLEQAFLVSRYVGVGKKHAALSKLGDGKWAATKKAAEKSIYDYAAKLLKTHALREAQQGEPFGSDTPWQKEFEDAFPYKETADQLTAIADTKTDMESPRSMDRLICGDVGFGKTEIAIRAAFKAALDGRQVAMMVPTTVLAQQHYDNFSERMARFPVVVELLSRYRTAGEQAQVARGLRDGSVDIVIGTHRLISKDIEFKDLGMLIVDEEQRFGVKHKERIKERFPQVDVLTLSATPIPRTLYMALTGARDLSTLETPPPNRYPIETVICGYDERLIRSAVDRELDRGGQVYFLHNRIDTIEKIATKIRHLCPRARVDMGHGQMNDDQLEAVMHRFVRGETDVLVATTIIESGLDIPNANTIVIDRADRFGLADLYQLRGRVGRGQHKAYAYLMLPRDLMTVGEARKRINAIKQYSSLGAGFKIALRDLEIRGAGNILGIAQSGHLTAVGFDLYCQLLKQAVSKLRGEKVRSRVETVIRLDFAATTEADYIQRLHDVHAGAHVDTNSPFHDKDEEEAEADRDRAAEVWPAYLPATYIEEPRLRIQAYRQLAGIAKRAELDELAESWRDRFGAFPETVNNLLLFNGLKLLGASRRVQQIEVREDKVMLMRGADYVLVGGKFPRLTSREPASKIRELSTLIENL